MKAKRIALVIALLLVPNPAAEFSAQEGPPPAVIQINVGLVQVDAVVTDSKGKPVKDLKPEDFEILQDGKPQKITNFEYVDLKSGNAPRGTPPRNAATRENSSPTAPPPPRSLRPQQIKRTVEEP